MKKIILFLLIYSFFLVKTTSATSDACSWHDGVNCSAGPGLAGNAVCNDGWTESSVRYIDVCKGIDQYQIAINYCKIFDVDYSGFKYEEEYYKIFNDCLKNVSSDESWQNQISEIANCPEKGRYKTANKLEEYCNNIIEKRKIDRVNLIQANLLKKEQGPCPQFSVFWTDTPGCTKETEQAFPANKNDCCVCYLDYKNYKRSCITDAEYTKKNVVDVVFAKKLGGKILLQIESHGEAWYVNPKTSEKYYMADGEKAFSIMRNLGVGITNKDLNKIKSNKTLAKNNSGKIFLQVESKGEAYYIDFNGIAHYLKDGVAAYEIMRSLGLGITNNDLNKIPDGSL